MTIADRLRAILPDPEPASGGTPPGPGEARRLSLALQGGGSLGAFAWGVLDALLEHGVRFDAVSGSSAGAVNAVLLASGLANGGRDRARELLERFWRHASEAASMQFVSSMFSWSGPPMSPYQFNPLDISPLRSLLRTEVDFDMLRQRSPIRLLIGATRVVDGRLRIFRESELTAEAIMASACLPSMSQAVEIDGEAYWDGGFSANPPLIPLVQATAVPDVLVVQIIPTQAPALPRSSSDIARRVAQITFNASLLRDLDTLASLTDVGRAPLPALFRKLDKSARLRLHRLSAEDHVAALASASATDLDWRFLCGLRDAGRAAANTWLGTSSTTSDAA
ncbi:MAG TPA: patatin-like phospholipase family protein [Lichenihabitans sp.]|jgi:NTE family protein|nr:patatin-like phospholipase family protein [Lichenihabitans sp.]